MYAQYTLGRTHILCIKMPPPKRAWLRRVSMWIFMLLLRSRSSCLGLARLSGSLKTQCSQHSLINSNVNCGMRKLVMSGASHIRSSAPLSTGIAQKKSLCKTKMHVRHTGPIFKHLFKYYLKLKLKLLKVEIGKIVFKFGFSRSNMTSVASM